MAEMNKINSFKSFTEIRNAEAQSKLKEESSTKRKQLAQKFESILDEMGISSYEDLDEDTQRNIISKILDEDHSDNPNDKYVVKPCDEPGTPWSVWEGDTRVECFKTEEDAKAYAEKQNKEQGLGEGNSFGDAVKKAKDAGEKEFEFEGKTYKVEESLVNEAIQVEGKRDAKKVVTQYNKIFNKSLVDFGAMTTESILGCIKYLMSEALHDANFHKEAEPTANMIKGNIRPLEIKMPGLGGHFVKIGPKTIKEILDKYYSDIANAAGWGGIGIVEGTALYLEQIKQEAMGQAALNKFNSMFEGEEVRIDVEAKINEAKVLESAAWEIGKDYPSYGVVVGITQNGDLCEVSFDSGQKIVFRDSGDKWIQEATVTEGRVKQFEMDLEDMIKEIKRGYGWIDPEFVEDTWENMSDSIDFELVKGEIYKRLIAAKLLAYASDEDEEEAGTYVKSLKELGIKESVITEARFVKDFNRDVLKAKTKEEVLELYPNAQFFIGKSDHFFGELDGNLFFKAYYTKAQKEFEIKSVYSEKGSNYVYLYNESVVTEASLSGIEFANDDDIHPTKFKPLVQSLKKNRVKMEVEKEEGMHGWPEVKLTGKRKDIEKVLADIWGPDSIEDHEDAYESVVTEGKKVKVTKKDIEDIENSGNIDIAYKKAMAILTSLAESVVTEARYNKKSLLKKLGSSHDAIIQTGNGKEYVIYNPDSNNDDNAAMWRNDDSVFAVDQDGEEHEIKYSDIVSYNESVVNEAEIKSDDEFQEYAFTVLKKAFGDDFDEEKGQEIVDGILSKSDGDYGAAVGMLTSSLG